MTRGIVFYAFNNETTDYEGIAKWNAKRVEKYLGLPSTIITDQNAIAESGGRRLMHPGRDTQKVTWLNAARYNAYEHSPYDQTIVLDVDYIVNSNQLLSLFDTNKYFAIQQQVADVTNRNDFYAQVTFGDLKFPQSWATVLYFTRDPRTKEIFDFVKMIKENYNHYANLYKFPTKPFRNDYAFSIALAALSGHMLTDEFKIPWPLLTSSHNVDIEVQDNIINLEYDVASKPMRLQIKDQDLHVLNKHTLGDLIGT
jgi:hypothetical protein